MLKEISMGELEEKNKRYIELKVDSAPMAAQLLENQLNCKRYAVTDKDRIEVYDDALDTRLIASCLVTHGVGLSSLYLRHETLEDYFTSLTGGARFE